MSRLVEHRALREAIRSVSLHRGIQAWLDLGIVDGGQLAAEPARSPLS